MTTPLLKERTGRDALVAALTESRARTDDLFSTLKSEALYERPIPERHRLIFYRGHLEAFDWNLVARQGYGLEPFDARFDRLFAFGIDPTDGGLPSEPASDWPALREVEAYNRRTRDAVDACLLDGRAPSSGDDPETLFRMAIEHRLMHAETLAYLFHQLPHGMKHARRDPVPPPARGDDARAWRSIPAGTAVLGRDRADGRFGWDNEFESHRIEVPAFTIGAHKVTNARFLEFVEDGGYEARSLWTDKDWAWKEGGKVRHPGFWTRQDGGWLYRGMFADHPLPEAAPVYVSLAEARAFARWACGAIPTEAQFHRAAYGAPDGDGPREYPWGNEAPLERHGNFGFRRWDPTPIGSFPEGRSAYGVEEMVGNGWEWTSSPFEPFPGFRPHPFYAGYSADFFDGDHYVMKGGSPRTATAFLRRAFRNWFQPRYPYVYATFRLVGA
jgi:gamma-glutamyl hercynylcysteine S-oxide synthase